MGMQATLVRVPEARRRALWDAPESVREFLFADRLHRARANAVGTLTQRVARSAHGSRLRERMERRLVDEIAALGAAPVSAVGGPSEEDWFEVGKAWHALHLGLTGTAWEGAFPESFLLLGGLPLDTIDFGYGAVRSLLPSEVLALHTILSPLPEAELRARIHPDHLNRLKIYPRGWSTAETEWLMEVFGALRRFVQGAAERDLALIVFLS